MAEPSKLESVQCPFCGSAQGEACIFTDGPAPFVDGGDGPRRVVHAARYAESLPPEERQAFWRGAVERYMAIELAAMDEAKGVPCG